MIMIITACTAAMAQETLPPLKDGKAPQTFEELWSGFDPRAEPIDVEVLKEWEEDGVVLKVLRYRIGVFKGQKAMMAAVYGYPKGGSNLPGLVQIHGGGQYAQYQAPLTNAKRGYATISLAWAGRIAAPGYQVDPRIVKLFWEGKTTDPNYKITTDWGALDAYHSPCRYPSNNFVLNPPSDHSLDPVASPRNSGWFLCEVAARRALTFLEQQPEVDKNRLGVYGHSMGGKIAVLTAGSDKRVKAAVPSCGGISDRYEQDPLIRATLGDDVYLKNISCPIMFLSPANDFHGRINDLQTAVQEIKTKDWRVTCSPHHNHQDTAEYEVATQLWFDQYLKNAFAFPQTPQTELTLKSPEGVPSLTIRPDASKNIQRLDVFYTQQGQMDGRKDDMNNTKNRFWHYVPAKKQGDSWVAELPLHSTDKPLWVYANVVYPLDKPVTGAGYYYAIYTTDRFTLSSLMHMVTPGELAAAGVRATLPSSPLIESFAGDWEREWFTYKPADWARTTHKVYDPQWAAGAGAKLALDVRSEQANKLVIGIDQFAAEVALAGGGDWETVTLSASDFQDAAKFGIQSWAGIKELRLAATEQLKAPGAGNQPARQVGAAWKGKSPEFRNLRWVEITKQTGGEVMNSKINSLIASGLVIVSTAATGFAEEVKINPWSGAGGDGNWGTAGNWVEGVPAKSQRAIINGGNMATVSSDNPATGAIVLGNGSAATLSVTGGSLEADITLIATAPGNYTATLNHSGGKFNPGHLNLGGSGAGTQCAVVNTTGGAMVFTYGALGTQSSGQWTIQGSQGGELTGNNLEVGKNGELKFVLDANGVRKLTVNAKIKILAGAKLTVDATAFKGNGPVMLIQSNDTSADKKLEGQFAAGNITVTGCKGGVKQDPATGEISLTLEAR